MHFNHAFLYRPHPPKPTPTFLLPKSHPPPFSPPPSTTPPPQSHTPPPIHSPPIKTPKETPTTSPRESPIESPQQSTITPPHALQLTPLLPPLPPPPQPSPSPHPPRPTPSNPEGEHRLTPPPASGLFYTFFNLFSKYYIWACPCRRRTFCDFFVETEV